MLAVKSQPHRSKYHKGWRSPWYVSTAYSVVGLCVASSLLFVGFKVGVAHVENPFAPDPAVVELQRDLTEQRTLLEQSHSSALSHMDAMALRLGRLQAHMYRLESLGERITQMTGIDGGEFDFSQAPAQGGPEGSDRGTTLQVPDFLQLMERLAEKVQDREVKLRALESILGGQELEEDSIPLGQPVQEGWLSSAFGTRIHPLTGKKHYHRGIDFAGREGSAVLAVASGVVTRTDRKRGYGKVVEINHGNGYVTRYGHNRTNLVEPGDTVRRGDVVALMGSTGKSTGPHVHFEVHRDGKILNPSRYIRASR